MQVITLNQKELEDTAALLAAQVEKSGAGRYDALIGIRRGGSHVCDAFCLAFPASLYGSRYDITMQRPGTGRKGKATAAILRRLPRKILDLMRMAESEMLSLLNRKKKAGETPCAAVDEELAMIMKNVTEPHVLLIDDAIDSGRTLSAVIATLKKMNHSARIETAVITETTAAPCVKADYCIYRNRTLIRFPWSNDYRQTPKAQHS